MPETDSKYDVFISYSHKDERWTDTVLRQRLDDAGFKVCIDYRNFEAGKMALLNMQDAAKQSKHVVLVLTRNWLQSEWSLFEALMGGTKDPAGLQKKLIPLLCEDGIQDDVNDFIAMRTWVDFTRKDREDNAWKRLFDALGKPDASRPKTPKPTRWFYGHRYGDLEAFTGRAAEMQMLDELLSNDKDNLLVLRALGGFGKTALSWHWFNNKVDKAKWPTAVWWSFYEKESGFESFLAETLSHLGVEVKQSARLQVNDLLEAMRGKNILIILDGFERLLRQYGRMDAALQADDEDAEIDPSQRDCSSIAAENFLRGLSGEGLGSKVLLTTRLCPRVLESTDGNLLKGCREEPLAAFSPDDAVRYFQKEEIKATRAEVIQVCAAYGYHPLSLSLLVGLIKADHEQRGDITAVKNLEIFADVKARRHHVLERAYNSLAPERRDLLSKISCFRGSMEYAVLKKVFPSPDLDKALLDLRKRGLLQYAGETQRYDMHPIVRHYAYAHFTDENRRKEAHIELAKYFGDNMPDKSTKVKTLEDLAPVIELYHHLVGAGNLDEGIVLYKARLTKPIYYQFGAYQLAIELLSALFLDGDDKPPRLKGESAQAWTLNALANAYSRSGQPSCAVPVFESSLLLAEKMGEKLNVAIVLGNVASLAQIQIGALTAAERNLHREIDVCKEIKDKFWEADGYNWLGVLNSITGNTDIAEQQFMKSLYLFEVVEGYMAFSTVWANRGKANLNTSNISLAFENFRRSLAFANEWSRKQYPTPRDYVRVHGLLGAAYRTSNELHLAEENLAKALDLCRQINAVDAEADILLDIAKLRYAQGDFNNAQEKASEALLITERCGYVLKGTDVNLFLAQFALEQDKDKVKAKQCAETALKLATCDGPPYYYKVAYDEAERFLENLSAL